MSIGRPHRRQQIAGILADAFARRRIGHSPSRLPSPAIPAHTHGRSEGERDRSCGAAAAELAGGRMEAQA